MNNSVTSDLSNFGYIELEELSKLINAMILHGLPDDFVDNEVIPMFNCNSGNVFLTNADYQVAMKNGEKLESWYTLPYYGTEGFLEDLIESYNNGYIHEEDFEYLADICENNGEKEKAEEIRNRLKVCS